VAPWTMPEHDGLNQRLDVCLHGSRAWDATTTRLLLPGELTTDEVATRVPPTSPTGARKGGPFEQEHPAELAATCRQRSVPFL